MNLNNYEIMKLGICEYVYWILKLLNISEKSENKLLIWIIINLRNLWIFINLGTYEYCKNLIKINYEFCWKILVRKIDW